MHSQLHREKIREIAEALLKAGYSTIDGQAKILGVPRSTAWTILSGHHKASGLSARIIQTMLNSPELPALVRAKILEYMADKAAGRFGTSGVRSRRFRARMSECGLVLPFLDVEEPDSAKRPQSGTDEQQSPERDGPLKCNAIDRGALG